MRIVIVEDEQQIRSGLTKLVERISPSYHVVGCVSNGVQGLSCVKTQHPDVVITDVRMPEMDGLEMIGALAASGIQPRYIIISAYSEFEYAKKAMSFGVSDYLLKPVSVAELTQALKKLELQLEASSVQEEVNSLDAAIRKLVLRDDSLDARTRMHIAEKYQLGSDELFAQVLFYFGQRYPLARDSIGRLTGQKLQSECRVVCAVPIESRQALLYVLIGIRDEMRFYTWLNSSTKIHAQTLWVGADVSMAFCRGFERLHETALGLLDALPWKISFPRTPLLRWPDVTETVTEQCAFPGEIENQMRTAICSRNSQKIVQQFQKFMEYFNGETVYKPQEIRECYTRFIWTALNLSKEVNILEADQVEMRHVMESILSAQNMAELNEVAQQLCALLEVALEQTEQQDQNITILRAKSLIHEFYASGITLEEIAQKLNLTPEYLSTQFHRDTGEMFSTYIRNYRVNKAKELLIGTQLKLHQVAAQVGYTDPKYFSQVFKKCTGQLPTEYRRANK